MASTKMLELNTRDAFIVGIFFPGFKYRRQKCAHIRHHHTRKTNPKLQVFVIVIEDAYFLSYIYIARFARDVDLAGKQTAQHIYKYLILYAAHTYTYHMYSRMCIGLCRIRSFILRSQTILFRHRVADIVSSRRIERFKIRLLYGISRFHYFV